MGLILARDNGGEKNLFALAQSFLEIVFY